MIPSALLPAILLAASGSGERAPRRLEDIMIEGEVRLPQVLFITSRESRRPLDWLDHTIQKIDMVLIMSVNPGFGGQKFIATALDKLRLARERIRASGREIRLEIDGGVKADNIEAIARAGADTFVAVSAIFGSKDYAATIAAMRDGIKRGS